MIEPLRREGVFRGEPKSEPILVVRSQVLVHNGNSYVAWSSMLTPVLYPTLCALFHDR